MLFTLLQILFVFYQDASRTNNKSQYDKFKETTLQSVQECTLRGQLELIKLEKSIDISEVVYNIYKLIYSNLTWAYCIWYIIYRCNLKYFEETAF